MFFPSHRRAAPRLRHAPPAAWLEPAFLYYLAANLLLKASVGLYGIGLLPRAALTHVLTWAETLTERGALSLHRRRARIAQRSGRPRW
jgi:hypothetical protein